MRQPQIFRREEMISVAQFAKALGISRSFAYQLVEKGVREGGILAFRYGEKKGIKIPRREVERYQQERQVVEG